MYAKLVMGGDCHGANYGLGSLTKINPKTWRILPHHWRFTRQTFYCYLFWVSSRCVQLYPVSFCLRTTCCMLFLLYASRCLMLMVYLLDRICLVVCKYQEGSRALSNLSQWHFIMFTGYTGSRTDDPDSGLSDSLTPLQLFITGL